MSDRVAVLEAEVKRLREWKRQQMELDALWDVQEVGRELGVEWGANILPQILPGIRKLKAELAELKYRRIK